MSHIFALMVSNIKTHVRRIRHFFSFSVSFVLVCVRVHSGEHELRVAEVLAGPCTCLVTAPRTSPGRVQEILGALHVL